MRRVSAKLKLTTLLAAVLVVAFLTVSLVNYHVSRRAAREEIMNSSLPLTSENVYSDILADLMRPIFISSTMANDAFLKDWALSGERSLEKIVAFLREIKEKYGFFSTFFVSAQSGKYYHFRGILKEVSPLDDHDVWFFDFMASGKEYDLDVDTNQAAENRLTIFINFRVAGPGGKDLGVAGVGLEMDQVAELLKQYQEKYARTIYMVDNHGLIQTHTRSEYVESLNIKDIPGLAALTGQVLTPIPEPRQFEYDTETGHTLLSVRYIPEFDWYLMVDQDQESILDVARGNLYRTLLIGLLASLVIVAVSAFSVHHFQGRLERMAGTDELTGVANRREFEAEFRRAAHRSARYHMRMCLALVDLDEFKEINDACGHLEGDRVIRAVAGTIDSTIRGSDLVARWGGDEFILLIDGGRDEALGVAERVRTMINNAELIQGPCRKGKTPSVTLSIGIAELRPGEELATLTARADMALYKAKELGRNRAEMEPEEA